MAERTGAATEPRQGGETQAVLSSEELRALLSPAATEGGEPVLVLTPGAETLAAVAAPLRERGATVTPAVNCFAALDLFRQRPYLGFVAFASALPSDVGWYLGRLREEAPDVRLCVVQDRDAKDPLPEGVPTIGPDLTPTQFDRLFTLLGLPPPQAGAEPRHAPPLSILPEREAPPVVGEEATGPTEESRPPDPFLAMRFLLEARLAGRPLAEGILRWARQDPGVRGWVEQREEGGELRLSAAADPGEDRRRMLALLLERGGDGGFTEPTAVGSFGLFPHPLGEGSWLAVWHRQAAAAERMVRGVQGLAPLLEEVGRGGRQRPAPDARERLAALLGTRMRAAERRKGRLGLLLFAPGSEEAGARLCKVLRALLRGGDWVESIGSRVYVILEEPDRRVFSALGARLRELPGVERLQVVALGWTPLDGNAVHLLERAEQILASGGQGEAIPGLGGEDRPLGPS